MTESPRSQPVVDDAWYVTAFGALYPVVYAQRTVEAAAPESAFAVEQLRIGSSDAVLDLCCGNGRHMVHLLERSASVVGLDYSRDLLCLARRNIGTMGSLVRGDMRALPFVEAFDVAVNFFTSFGYFMDPEENCAVARGMARALRVDGRFFMDYLNAPHVEATLVPHSEREQDGFHIAEDRWIDAAAHRVNKRTTVHKGDEVVLESGESVRLYRPPELFALLRDAGLEIDRVFGDYEGRPLDETRPRMLITGHRMRQNA